MTDTTDTRPGTSAGGTDDSGTAATIETGLRALVDARMDAGRALAHAAAQRDAVRAQLDAAEHDYATAHAAALAAGWTSVELKKVGLEEPTTRATRGRRKTRTTTPKATHDATNSEA